MRILSIDIETYSSVDLAKCGVYAYSEAVDFEILLFAYAFQDEYVKVIDVKRGEKLPVEVIEALSDSQVLKTAFNANFERTCIGAFLKRDMPPEQWLCTEVMALELGLPASLAAVAKSLKLPLQKMAVGNSLIRFFCSPCKETKANGYKRRYLPEDAMEKWQSFKAYCAMDVEVERKIRKQLESYKVHRTQYKVHLVDGSSRDFQATHSGSEANGFIEFNTGDFEKECSIEFPYTARGASGAVCEKERLYLSHPPIDENEKRLWNLDQCINDRGVRLDSELIDHAVACHNEFQDRLRKEAVSLMGIENPKSAAQMKKWLLDTEGLEIDTLSKERVANLLKEVSKEKVKRALELRQQLSKTSIKKYEAMKRALCKDSTVRGLLQFYGANRTGRWAGRLVQVQNLPQNKIKDLNIARKLLKAGEYETLELLFDSVPEVLSQLIRTAFIPAKASRFIIADFSAIEARVIAWLAGERWRMEVFNGHGKIYEASAAVMFKVPVEKVTKDSILRQKGKIAELALGYQGGKGALLAMGASKMGIKEQELPELVASWRNANRNIVKLWSHIEAAATTVVRDKTSVSTEHNIVLSYEKGILFIKLPSGRKLSYISPRLEIDENYNKSVLTYEGVDGITKQWTRLKTYGGKLTENIVQAIARDCLADAMLRLEASGYKIVMHIHDEVVLDVPFGFGSLEEVNDIMAFPIHWAKGLPLRAEAFEAEYYKKS
jgi:DNA polymerase